MLATILKVLGFAGANAGTTGCMWLFMDEPETPKSLIK